MIKITLEEIYFIKFKWDEVERQQKKGWLAYLSTPSGINNEYLENTNCENGNKGEVLIIFLGKIIERVWWDFQTDSTEKIIYIFTHGKTKESSQLTSLAKGTERVAQLTQESRSLDPDCESLWIREVEYKFTVWKHVILDKWWFSWC